jgi:TusA-related sulfurtransferase
MKKYKSRIIYTKKGGELKLGGDDSIHDPHKTIDVRGLTCPHPVLNAAKALRNIRQGEVLEVVLDYELSAKRRIPDNICKKYDCNYETREERDNSGKVFWRIYIEKSDNPVINFGSK